MSNADAKHDGETRARLMLARIREAEASTGQKCAEVRMVDYETEEDYMFLRPGDPWSHGYQKMVLRAVKKYLRKNGIRAKMHVLNIRDYFNWLAKNNLKDSTENRAAFISL